jgi:hypothetical protein
MLNFIFLVLGVGGAIVGAFTLPDFWWKWGIIIFFGLMGLIGFGLIVRDWWRGEGVPKFNLTITGLNVEHGFAEDPMKCRYLVNGSIDNDGAPSIAKNWTLMVFTPGKQPFQARRLIIQVDSVVGIPNGPPRQLSPARALSVQTNNKAWGSIDGYEWFEVTPLSRADASNPDTRLTLSAQDRSGKIFSVTTRIGDLGPRIEPTGGKGGSGEIFGNHGTIIGGKGGNVGPGAVGRGGDGGGGVIHGDGGTIIGGEGGSVDGANIWFPPAQSAYIQYLESQGQTPDFDVQYPGAGGASVGWLQRQQTVAKIREKYFKETGQEAVLWRKRWKPNGASADTSVLRRKHYRTCIERWCASRLWQCRSIHHRHRRQKPPIFCRRFSGFGTILSSIGRR